MIIAVTGWRHWTDSVFIQVSLRQTCERFGVPQGVPLHVRIGDAEGADEVVREWCTFHSVSHKVFAADWGRHGKAAGPIRNRQMLEGEGDLVTGPTELLLAFPGRHRPVKVPGSGSWGCCIEAALMGIRVEIPPYKHSGD
jgi:hypothetical protein